MTFLPEAPAQSPQVNVNEVVQALQDRYRSSKSLKATFLERYREGRRDVRIESGTVYFRRPGRMRWEYSSPEEKLFIADGNQLWFYVPADRTVTRSKLKESGDWHAALSLFMGSADLSRVCGRIELLTVPAGPARPDGYYVTTPGHRLLRCLPKSKDAPFDDALLELDPAYRIARVLIREPAGIETEFRFAAWQENLPLADSFFRYTAPPGVAIVDAASLLHPR